MTNYPTYDVAQSIRRKREELEGLEALKRDLLDGIVASRPAEGDVPAALLLAVLSGTFSAATGTEEA